jgi:hypothetical protein
LEVAGERWHEEPILVPVVGQPVDKQQRRPSPPITAC